MLLTLLRLATSGVASEWVPTTLPLEQPDVIGEVAQFAQGAFFAVMVTPVALVPFNAIGNVILDAVKQHLAADDGRGTAKRAHCILTGVALHHASQTSKHALLALRWYIRWRGHDVRQAGSATGTIG